MSNHPAQILTSKVTIRFTRLTQAVPGVVQFTKHPVQDVSLGIQPNWSCGIPLQPFQSLLHPSVHTFPKLSLYNRTHSSPHLLTSNKHLTTTLSNFLHQSNYQCNCIKPSYSSRGIVPHFLEYTYNQQMKVQTIQT